MIFSSKKALDHLMKYGRVVTFRIRERKEGYDWITDRRGGRKIADVKVKLIDVIEEPSNRATVFLKYLRDSGFNSVGEWWDEIVNLNGMNKFYKAEKGYFYLVEIVNSWGYEAVSLRLRIGDIITSENEIIIQSEVTGKTYLVKKLKYLGDGLFEALSEKEEVKEEGGVVKWKNRTS